MRTLLSAALIYAGLTTSAIAADWPQFRRDHSRSASTDAQLAPGRLTEVWKRSSPQPPAPAWPGPAKWDAYAKIKGLRSMRDYDLAFHVAVVGSSLYYGSSTDDSVYCVDTSSGETRWRYTTDGPVRMAPTVAAGRVYFGSDDGHAYCLDADRGTLIWRSTPAISQALTLKTPGGNSPSITIESDQTEKLILNNGRFISHWPCRTGVLVDGETAYFGLSLLPWRPSYLCAVDAATGRRTNDQHFVTQLSGQTLEGGILLHDGRLIVLRGRVAPQLFAQSTGRSLGTLKHGGGGVFATVTTDGQLLHGPGNKTGWVTRTDLASKERNATFGHRNAALVSADQLILCADDRVSAFDASGQNELWSSSLTAICDIVRAGDSLFVGQQDRVSCINFEDGETTWEAEVEGRARGLAVANDALFVATDSGAIYCFRESDAPADSVTRLEAQGTSTPDQPDAVDSSNIGELVSDSIVAPSDDDDVAGRWVFHSAMGNRARRRGLKSPERRVQDRAGTLDGLISGNVQVREVGGVEALELDGSSNSILISEDFKEARLPETAISVEAWVRIDEPLRWGGIAGAFQDNGSFERGWILGYQNSRFSFGLAATNGPPSMTYLDSKTKFESQSWYHVVGTYDGKLQRVFVNGELESEATQETGAIRYPETAFFELGAYHDKDENYRLTGMLHEVAVYSRALTNDDVRSRYEAKVGKFAVPIRLASGPVATFTGRHSATIRWSTSEDSPTRLKLTGHGPDQSFANEQKTQHHVVHLTKLKPDTVGHYTIRTESAERSGLSQSFELDSTFNYSLSRITGKSPYSKDVSDRAERIATQCMNETHVDRGMCVVFGLTDGSLAYALARNSQLQVVCVDSDPKRVLECRTRFLDCGAYGRRLSVRHVSDLASLPFTSGFANLIVTELPLKQFDTESSPLEIYRVLRPFGGVAWFSPAGQAEEQIQRLADKWRDTLTEEPVEYRSLESGAWAAIRPASAGVGEWSHLYGKADNAAFGGETLAGATTSGELEVQWLGRPGPRAQPDRNGRKPSPLSMNGRLYVQGLHRLIGIDAMNGTPLWSLEIPALERFNMPRDCGNWCADQDSVYVAVRDECWKIDGNSGQIVTRRAVLPGRRSEWEYDWSYIARVGDVLLGSAVKRGTAYTNFWGNAEAGWYDARTGSTTYKVCSESLFALTSDLQTTKWEYHNGLVINSTLTADDTHLFFVECRNDAVKNSTSRRVGMPEMWQEQYLVALDLRTGQVSWERPLDTADGTVVFNMAKGDDRLILSSSNDKHYDVYAFSAQDGADDWQQQVGWMGGKGDHGKAMSRPAIVNGSIYLRPQVLDLASGKVSDLKMPGGGCGTYAATANALFFRSSNVTAWDLESGSTTSWDRLRPGCWLSTIPANGMLLSPEAGGGCSCGSWLETSIGFKPVVE